MELPSWLVISIVASIVLTLIANVVVRWGSATRRRSEVDLRRLVGRDPVSDRADRPPVVADGRRDVRVWVPWRAMIVVSLGLTIVLNLVLLLTR